MNERLKKSTWFALGAGRAPEAFEYFMTLPPKGPIIEIHTEEVRIVGTPSIQSRRLTRGFLLTI